ncbi:unnamed protein product [Mytilus edulis]|uniref:Endonuclease/exonuclease/phosphatase domain-containing protein n=1 Tax=Mytilus edulis TaxID=6550 RepID=A0A8S3PY09_MYTED|nr:unnamed protein product [Mytilus edulis]
MIENDIVKYSQSGKIMIAGDLNARTACEIDHIQKDSDKHIPLFDNYKCDSSLIQRKSKDSSINTRGRQLLSLCISSSLRILNGRLMGDLMGAHTCFQPLGSSVVDYFLASEELLENSEWQDQDIINLKQNLYRKYKLMQNHNTDPYVRGSFFKCLESYRKQRRAKIRKFKRDIMNKLDNLYDQNPKAYWQLLDKIKNISNNSQNKSENTIDPSEWQEYFQKLNKNEQYSDDLIKKKLESFHNENVFNELDYLITPEEIEKAIKSLKNSKSIVLNLFNLNNVHLNVRIFIGELNIKLCYAAFSP